MHDVVLIVYPGFELLDASGPAAVFNGANRELASLGKERLYGIKLASACGGLVHSSCGITVDTDAINDLGDDEPGTLLVVGSEREPLMSAMREPMLQSALPPLVSRSRRHGSVCTGVFLLAGLGIIDGRRVSTHWDACAPLTKAFDTLDVDPDALYVNDENLWTSAGVTTGIDMALAMVAADIDTTIASEVAKRLVLYARRPGYQSQFSPMLMAQSKAESPFSDLIGWINQNLDKPLDIPSLAQKANLSERTFHRKFQAATGETPARYVETARLDAARLLLSRGTQLKTVAAHVGLFPTARFVEAFERRFGISPRLYREMHAAL